MGTMRVSHVAFFELNGFNAELENILSKIKENQTS